MQGRLVRQRPFSWLENIGSVVQAEWQLPGLRFSKGDKDSVPVRVEQRDADQLESKGWLSRASQEESCKLIFLLHVDACLMLANTNHE